MQFAYLSAIDISKYSFLIFIRLKLLFFPNVNKFFIFHFVWFWNLIYLNMTLIVVNPNKANKKKKKIFVNFLPCINGTNYKIHHILYFISHNPTNRDVSHLHVHSYSVQFSVRLQKKKKIQKLVFFLLDSLHAITSIAFFD